MVTAARSTQIAPASDYDMGDGWVIEQFAYWNQAEPSWAIPDWTERGLGHLDGVFPSKEAAERALREPV